MPLKLSGCPLASRFDDPEAAERFIETRCPAGYLYEIVVIEASRQTDGPFWAVRVRNDALAALGYASNVPQIMED